MKQAHICLDETLGVRYAILPGDPARLDRVAAQLESVRELAYNREFRSLTGTYKGVPVLAVSTGIGGSSAGICVEELHNIGVEAAIRIGSCGALQTGIALGDLILGCGAIRDDGASKAYVYPEYPAVADYQLLGLCVEAAKALGCPYHVGIIHSHESFYHEENDTESAYWSRKGTLGARRLAASRLQQPKAVQKLFDKIVPAMEGRKGGYTRILKLGARKGDAAPMCLLQWVSVPEVTDAVPEAAPAAEAPKAEEAK